MSLGIKLRKKNVEKIIKKCGYKKDTITVTVTVKVQYSTVKVTETVQYSKGKKLFAP
jgi:hypothetical protein